MTDTRQSWDNYFISMAALVASRSKDPSTQVGSVIVGPDHEVRSTGFNGFARGIMDSDDRLNDRDVKLMLTVHAEENAIFNAARIGVSTKGCHLYLSGLPPCAGCAKAIIQAGVIRVLCRSWTNFPERWAEQMRYSRMLLDEAAIERIEVHETH